MSFSSGRKSSSKRQDRGEDDNATEFQIKRHGPEKVPARCHFDTISAQEVAERIGVHMTTSLPPCDKMFPWLHGYSTSAPPEYEDAISIVRAEPMSRKWIQNSGILKSSLDPHEFMMTWTNDKNYCHPDKKESALILRNLILQQLASISEVLSDEDIDGCVTLCLKYNILPFLATDAFARQTYGARKKWKVCNSFQQGSGISDYMSCSSRQPGAFRRFDIQPAKMVEMSSTIVIYSLLEKTDDNDVKNPEDTSQQLATLIMLALKFVQRNYGSEDNIQHNIRILSYSSLEEIPIELIATPPIPTSALTKPTRQQLVSQFDVVSFNNWDRDLLYREKLEISKMSSATCITDDSSVWFGNSTDYQIYKMLADSFRSNDNIQPHSTYYSMKNSIVDIPSLEYNLSDEATVDSKIFNIPNASKRWALMLRCSENSVPPTLEKLWETLTFLLECNTNKRIELDFPSSGTITLGSLNIEFIKVILNTCFVIYQISKKTNLGTLVHCSDGYTETSFLLVAYTIFLRDLSLDDALIELHLKKERPFFLFHVDLQVLGHLQTLFRNFSPRRPDNAKYFSFNESGKFEPLSITAEMFSRVFLYKVPMESDLTNLKGPLPSRILSHLYLGSLEHAQSPALLKKLGINYIVSVGEVLSWTDGFHEKTTVLSTSSLSVASVDTITNSTNITIAAALEKNGFSDRKDSSIEILQQDGFKILRIMNLGDNGKDTLTHQLEKILAFIDEGYSKKGKVLVHCMVGVSRSATVCIAECMKRLHCDILRAYLFVRVRRLNIIIQPNLMFMYELLKWQEFQGGTRNIDWHILCRSISELNNNYI